MTENKTLRMVLPLSQLSVFFPLFQQGLLIRAKIGCSVMALLTGQFGIAEDYVIERITTLFLDGKALDDLENSYVKDGSTLALSSAMPGLVGATMRRGGHLASMRGEITYQDQQHDAIRAGSIRIKLYNMVMAELGAVFLAHGVRLSNGELVELLEDQSDSFWQSFGVSILGGRQIDPVNLAKLIRLEDPSEEILLEVEFKS